MCTHSPERFAARRKAVLDAMSRKAADSVLVLFAAPLSLRNGDVDHEYRQDSDLYYLTGFEEPECVLVLSATDRKATLFLRPRDPEREVWDGPRTGVEGAKTSLHMDEAFVVADLDEKLPKLLENKKTLFYRLGKNRTFDDRVLRAIDKTRGRARFGVTAPVEVVEPGVILHEMRLFKDDQDLDAMRAAAKITEEAHLGAMGRARPGVYEYEVEALLLETFRRHGSDRPAYGCIVGSGENATVLHYRANHRRMESGDLLLIDAGCEYGYFASDVTRTFPVNGRFSREQQAVYELVLEAQLAGIGRVRAGATLEQVHRASLEVLTAGLVRLGLLSGERDKLIETEAYKPFYMHRTSHWLGMDVHDVGAYFVDGKPRTLAAGMVLTVEPGIYIAKENASVRPEWRGIGVRIEDDILVTDGDPVNLTKAIPKTVAEVERACAA